MGKGTGVWGGGCSINLGVPGGMGVGGETRGQGTAESEGWGLLGMADIEAGRGRALAYGLYPCLVGMGSGLRKDGEQVKVLPGGGGQQMRVRGE